MFEQKNWVVACTDCKQKLDLEKDTIQNLIDNRGNIITKCYNALEEFVNFSNTLNIHFPRIEAVKEFVDLHKDHILRIAPVLDDEFNEYKVIKKEIKSKPIVFLSKCEDCKQKTDYTATLYQEHEIPRTKATIQKIELFNQLLELYNLLGCKINNQQITLELEQFLPFFKRHAGHDVYYAANGKE